MNNRSYVHTLLPGELEQSKNDRIRSFAPLDFHLLPPGKHDAPQNDLVRNAIQFDFTPADDKKIMQSDKMISRDDVLKDDHGQADAQRERLEEKFIQLSSSRTLEKYHQICVAYGQACLSITTNAFNCLLGDVNNAAMDKMALKGKDLNQADLLLASRIDFKGNILVEQDKLIATDDYFYIVKVFDGGQQKIIATVKDSPRVTLQLREMTGQAYCDLLSKAERAIVQNKPLPLLLKDSLKNIQQAVREQVDKEKTVFLYQITSIETNSLFMKDVIMNGVLPNIHSPKYRDEIVLGPLPNDELQKLNLNEGDRRALMDAYDNHQAALDYEVNKAKEDLKAKKAVDEKIQIYSSCVQECLREIEEIIMAEENKDLYRVAVDSYNRDHGGQEQDFNIERILERNADSKEYILNVFKEVSDSQKLHTKIERYRELKALLVILESEESAQEKIGNFALRFKAIPDKHKNEVARLLQKEMELSRWLETVERYCDGYIKRCAQIIGINNIDDPKERRDKALEVQHDFDPKKEESVNQLHVMQQLESMWSLRLSLRKSNRTSTEKATDFWEKFNKNKSIFEKSRDSRLKFLFNLIKDTVKTMLSKGVTAAKNFWKEKQRARKEDPLAKLESIAEPPRKKQRLN
ncbi:MAG: hypothetical protein ACD_60C00029G0014 [uncultured bacterium]|nr:MAG: hypothetical protein ACD_60C00029G0014 [uncultured bacterium]